MCSYIMRFVQGGVVNVKCASFINLEQDGSPVHNENGPWWLVHAERFSGRSSSLKRKNVWVRN